MKKWAVYYVVGSWYKYKEVYADTAEQAIRKARVKTIVDLKPIEEEA